MFKAEIRTKYDDRTRRINVGYASNQLDANARAEDTRDRGARRHGRIIQSSAATIVEIMPTP
jgi:hypothetical protein